MTSDDKTSDETEGRMMEVGVEVRLDQSSKLVSVERFYI